MSQPEPDHVLDSVDTLRGRFGPPLDVAVALEKSELDEHHCQLIEHCPFVCIATADAQGQPVVSPKGDAPGFVKVLNSKTLLIPDRPGNNKVLGFSNLVENPKLALLFVIPGYAETLRIEGKGRVVVDDDLVVLGEAKGKIPPAALLVQISKAYVHCGKSMIRSRLWDPERHVQTCDLPTLGKLIKEQSGKPVTVEQADGLVAEEYRKNLY